MVPGPSCVFAAAATHLRAAATHLRIPAPRGQRVGLPAMDWTSGGSSLGVEAELPVGPARGGWREGFPAWGGGGAGTSGAGSVGRWAAGCWGRF